MAKAFNPLCTLELREENVLRRQPKIEALLEGSRKRFGSELHVDGPATANARPPYMCPVDVADVSVDGWQPSEDAVVMQSQRLISNVLSDTAVQCRPGVGASLCYLLSTAVVSFIYRMEPTTKKGKTKN